MKGLPRTVLPLEPLVQSFVEAGMPTPAALAARADAVSAARAGVLSDSFLASASDAAFQTEIVRFYEACVSPALHADRLTRRARLVRHGATHLLRCADPLPEKMRSCVDPSGPYFVVGLGPSFWSAVAQGLWPERHPAWTTATVLGLRRLGFLDREVVTFAALLDAVGRIRAVAPTCTALAAGHFLTLVSVLDGRRLLAGADRLGADLFADSLREVRTEEALRRRLRERGQALADAQGKLVEALADGDGKRLSLILAAADPDGHDACRLDWKACGESLTRWIRSLWESDDPLSLLDDLDESIAEAGPWLSAAVLHLRDPQRFPLWNDSVRAGQERLDDAAPFGSIADRYRLHCEASTRLFRNHFVHPLELAEVFSRLGERETSNGDETSPRFGGFCPDTFRFMADLERNNSRDWLRAEQGRYRFAVREPLLELCRALGERYIEPVLRGRDGLNLERRARDGLALTRLTRNSFGRGKPYNSALWIAFCGRDELGRDPTQFFVRLDASGLTFGLALGARTAKARRLLRLRLLDQAAPLHAILQQRGGYDGDLDSFLAWIESGELSLSRHLSPESPLLDGDDLVGEVLLTFDRLLPLYFAATASAPVPRTVAVVEPDFERTTHLSSDWLTRAKGLVRMKGQVILHGVPGTGKTHVARRLALGIAGHADAVCLAQFHPAYGYEEFVEGIRVRSIESNGRHEVVYPVEDGLLCSLAAKASARPSQPHVLILDEINRANLPRVFGELLYLLEYRDQEVMLPCSRRSFRLPANLFLIGTMNASDRSTAALDLALRRRFAFIEMTPDASVLRSWFAAHPPEAGEDFAEDVIGAFEKLNARLERDLGPECRVGHSYFMTPALDESRLRSIWQHQVRPLLLEHLTTHPAARLPLELDDYRAKPRRRVPVET